VACPYFRPIERFAPASWLREPRSPLGAEWRGVCQASAAGEQSPSEQMQRDTCNVGYGRQCCSWYPADGDIDAVRFSVVQESGDGLIVRYILERDYAPASHGTFEWKAGAASQELPEPVARQATAFLEWFASRRLRA
jgi:hypothetical protein